MSNRIELAVATSIVPVLYVFLYVFTSSIAV